MVEDHPDTLAFIAYNLTSPYYSAFGNMRAGLYGLYWIPYSVHDGIYNASPTSTYESKFLSRQLVTTDVTIDMEVFGGGNTWNVSAAVCIEPDGAGKDMKIWMAQVVDNWGPSYLQRNTVRAGSDGVEITLAADECLIVTETFVLDSYSLALPDDVKFFAWAQDPIFYTEPYPNPPPDEYYFAEVYQAAKTLAPFEGVFIDGFEAGDTAAWSSMAR
jgi:hypothetical protein